MALTVQVEGLSEAIAGLHLAERDILSAAAVGLTRLAAEGKKQVQENMQRNFDRPTPWTMKSIGIRMATRENVEAIVELKDDTLGKGGNFRDVLRPQFEGGIRGDKRFERMWQRQGLLFPGQQTVVARGWRNRFGNLNASTIVQISAFFDQFRTEGFSANMGAKGRAKFVGRNALRFFVARKGRDKTNHLAPGIYAASAGANESNTIAPVLLFSDRQSYRRRIDLPTIVIATAQRNGVRIMAAAVAQRLQRYK